MEDSVEDDGLEEEQEEDRPPPSVGAVWKHKLLQWTVVIDRITFHTIEFHTRDRNDPDFLQTSRSRENFMEEFFSFTVT